MANIKVCAVQFAPGSNFKKNLARAEKFFRIANSKGCKIICFPEIFLTGPLDREKYNSIIPLQSKNMFSKLSKNYGIFAVMGSIIEKIKNNFYNISYLFDDRGKVIGSYKKNHLVKKSEAKFMTPGTQTSVFKTKIGNIGIEICRDLLYPEVSRKMMIAGADIIFCPSFWCSESPSYDWEYSNKYFKNMVPDEVTALSSARAIESTSFFVYVNAAGGFNSHDGRCMLLGKTQIASPFYGTTGILRHNREGVLIKNLDLGTVEDARKVYKIGMDLKDYYATKKEGR